MRKTLTTAALMVLMLTLLTGVAYPLVVTGISQVVFENRANGSLVAGGSKLVGTPRLIGRRPDPHYFQPRPSATGYSAEATYFSNRGPNSAAARFFYRDELASYLELNRKGNPGLTARRVPVDAVTTSGSGIDPQISEANAAIQSRRVAAERGIPDDRVDALVDKYTDGRFLGVIGEPGVNVTELNLALDQDLR